MVSVATTQFCIWSEKTAIDNMEANECDYVPVKLYLEKEAVGWTILINT